MTGRIVGDLVLGEVAARAAVKGVERVAERGSYGDRLQRAVSVGEVFKQYVAPPCSAGCSLTTALDAGRGEALRGRDRFGHDLYPRELELEVGDGVVHAEL